MATYIYSGPVMAIEDGQIVGADNLPNIMTTGQTLTVADNAYATRLLERDLLNEEIAT